MKCKDCVFCREYYHGNCIFSARCIWYLKDIDSSNDGCTHWKGKDVHPHVTKVEFDEIMKVRATR